MATPESRPTQRSPDRQPIRGGRRPEAATGGRSRRIRCCRSAQRADRSDGDPARSAEAAAAARLPGAGGTDREPADAVGARSGGGRLLRDLPGAARRQRAEPITTLAGSGAAGMRASPGGARARAPAGARHDASRHPARQRVPERAGPAGRARPVPGPRRRRWRSRRCSNRPIQRCACRPAAATAASPTMSMRSACCCCAWRSAARRWRSSTMRRSCAASWNLGPTPRWRAIERLPPIIGDLVRGMLAEDPEHRPTADLAARPGERAWTSGRGTAAAAGAAAHRHGGRRGLGCTVAGLCAWRCEPDHGLNAVRGNAVEQWLRRGLGDAQLATRVEELVRHRSLDRAPDDGDGEAELVMRAIAVLDPLAPLCWRGVALWPDGIGTALAAAQGSDPDRWRGLRKSSSARRPATGRRCGPTGATSRCCASRRASSTVGCSSAARAAACRG